MIEDEYLDLAAAGEYQTKAVDTNLELLAAFEGTLENARRALRNTTDEHLMTTWQLRYGTTADEPPRF